MKDMIRDPYLVFYADLSKHDGAQFMSDDAYGHLCTVTGAVWGSQGRTFDGDDYINIDTALTSLQTNTSGTCLSWLKIPDATPAGYMGIMGFGDTNANEYIIIQIAETTGLLLSACRSGGSNQWGVQTNTNPFTSNTWVNVALVQDGVSPVLYVNGVAVAQTFTTSTNKTKWFLAGTGLDNGRIGCINYNSAGNISLFTGTIRETLIYNRALTPTEIQQNYLATKWRYA